MLRIAAFQSVVFFLVVAAASVCHSQKKGQAKPPMAPPAPKFVLPGTTPVPSAPASLESPPNQPVGNKSEAKPEKERVPIKLDIKKFGRPEGKELDVSMRYYLWSDGDGWHLRSCCKDNFYATFKGEITLTNGGTFDKFRTIELERKGQHPDAWELSEDRTKLEFKINSSDHPDGFDFTVKGKDATVIFDLKIQGKEQPKRIFIGHDNLHPPSAYFEFDAKHD